MVRRGGRLITPDGNYLRRRAAHKLLTADGIAAISGLKIDRVYAVSPVMEHDHTA